MSDRSTPEPTWTYFGVLRETLFEWDKDRVPRLGAALAFYSFFSIAPLLVIAVVIGSRLYGLYSDGQNLDAEVRRQLQDFVGEQSAITIEDMMRSAHQSHAGPKATLMGIVGLLFGATGAVVALKDALDTIWGVMPAPGRGWWAMIRDRFLSLVIVLIVGFLLLVSATLTTTLSLVARYAEEQITISLPTAEIINVSVSIVVAALLFATVFKFLPDIRIAWRDVWFGASITALLFLLGKELFALYMRHFGIASAYGAAGSLAVLLLFLYYSAQILFLGAEFTQVYARVRGVKVTPKRGAVRVADALEKQFSANAPPMIQD